MFPGALSRAARTRKNHVHSLSTKVRRWPGLTGLRRPIGKRCAASSVAALMVSERTREKQLFSRGGGRGGGDGHGRNGIHQREKRGERIFPARLCRKLSKQRRARRSHDRSPGKTNGAVLWIRKHTRARLDKLRRTVSLVIFATSGPSSWRKGEAKMSMHEIPRVATSGNDQFWKVPVYIVLARVKKTRFEYSVYHFLLCWKEKVFCGL